MKRFFFVLIAVQIFSSNHFLVELMKMPQLVQHYHEHYAENNDLNVFSFLKMHYANPEHQEKDAARHEHLPLKSDDCTHVNDFVKMRCPQMIPSVSATFSPFFVKKNKPVTPDNRCIVSTTLFAVFHPPQFC
jgi:hypothetical protein